MAKWPKGRSLVGIEAQTLAERPRVLIVNNRGFSPGTWLGIATVVDWREFDIGQLNDRYGHVVVLDISCPNTPGNIRFIGKNPDLGLKVILYNGFGVARLKEIIDILLRP